MTKTAAARCPIQCIIPPYMTDYMVEHGDAETRRRGIDLLRESARIRGQREVRSPMAAMMAMALSVGRKQISIYDAKNGGTLQDRVLVRREGEANTGDPAVDEAYNGLDATYEYYQRARNRTSIDNGGMRLDATVHFGRNFPNALWDGGQMIFGDGDGRAFNRFTIDLEIIAHELTHGVIDHTSRLEYRGQSGALNESFADVMGILVKQFSLKQPASDSDWLIGRGILISSNPNDALRSMRNPGNAYRNHPYVGDDPQPDHMSGYVRTVEDDGGVHINSGIPNRAFVLTASEISGNAWQHAGEIWYRAMLLLRETADFNDMANATERYAGEVYGFSSNEYMAVVNAWQVVGVKPLARTLPPAEAPFVAASREAAPNLESIVERVAERLGTKLVEVLAAEFRRLEETEKAATAPPAVTNEPASRARTARAKSKKKVASKKRRTAKVKEPAKQNDSA